MSILSVSEKFEEIMANVPNETHYAPASIQECKETKIKRPPLSDARVKIDEKAENKRRAKVAANKSLTEAAEKISDLYSAYVLEGVLDNAKDLNPEKKDKIEALKIKLSEAALGAKDFLGA